MACRHIVLVDREQAGAARPTGYLWGSGEVATSGIGLKCSAAELIEFILANTKDGVCDLRAMPKSAKLTGRFGVDS
jgi:hypothetical protein